MVDNSHVGRRREGVLACDGPVEDKLGLENLVHAVALDAEADEERCDGHGRDDPKYAVKPLDI